MTASRAAAGVQRGDGPKDPPTVGIIGGMGPEATVHLMGRILAIGRTAGLLPRIVVDCNPAIPSRLAAIEGRGPSPAPLLGSMAARLESLGAHLLVLACNAAHHFYREVQAACPRIPLLDLVGEVVKVVEQVRPQGAVVVLGAAEVVERLYLQQLGEAGLATGRLTGDERTLLDGILTEASQANLGSSVKAKAHTLADGLGGRGCSHIVLACTELALALEGYAGAVILIDPLEIAAQRAVDALSHSTS